MIPVRQWTELLVLESAAVSNKSGTITFVMLIVRSASGSTAVIVCQPGYHVDPSEFMR